MNIPHIKISGDISLQNNGWILNCTRYGQLTSLTFKCTAKPYSFLAIDATCAPENPLRFRKNHLERI